MEQTPVTPFDPKIKVDRHGEIHVKPFVKALVEKDRAEACPQRTPIWYKKRREHLTASSIASAVGENPYEKRQTAIRKKVGFGPGFTGNVATEHGNKYEDVAIELYEKKTKERVISVGLLESIKNTHLGEDVDTSFLAGSPDGITASGKLIEVKCPYRRKPNGEVPSHYVHQIQTLMHILDIPTCDFIEYVPSGTWTNEVFIVVHVPRCDIFWATNFIKLQRFWADVVSIRKDIDEKGEEHVELATREPEKRKRAKPTPKPAVCDISLDEDLPPQPSRTLCISASINGTTSNTSSPPPILDANPKPECPLPSSFILALESLAKATSK
jgi:putative phage-type endonuclease